MTERPLSAAGLARRQHPARTELAGSLRPPLWLPGGHLQTIVPSVWPAPAVGGRAETRIVAVEPGTRVRLDVNRPRDGAARGTLLLVHGMGGCARSAYMQRTARAALARGWTAVRLNLRNCGGTEALAGTLYNAGQSGDVTHVLEYLAAEEFPRPFTVVGFSLGGNLTLRYAGLAGAGALADAVAGVNPPVDLERCATAIEQPGNRLYQTHYVRRLAGQLRRIRAVREMAGPRLSARRIGSVRNFDRLYTAPDAGYPSAEAYYAAASAAPVLAGIRRPGLVLSARNDPFVPPSMFDPLRQIAGLRFLLPAHGGHCGYWQRGRPLFWAGSRLLDFFEEVLP